MYPAIIRINARKYSPFSGASFNGPASGVQGRTVTTNKANKEVTSNENAGFDCTNGSFGERNI